MTNTATPPSYSLLKKELIENPRTWLVTGVAGFIGSNLLQELLVLGQTVVGLDNFSTGYQANLDDAIASATPSSGRFRMITGDIRDLDVCRRAASGVDFVLHQAALGSVPRSIDDPRTSHEVNVDGFLNVLVAARDAGVNRVVYASSSSVYGDATRVPQVEEHVGRPLSPYAVTKASSELYANVFHRTYGLEVVGLRYFNVFGRRQDPKGAYAAVIPRWIANLLSGIPCGINGDGETSRDFCYVANTVQANLLAATVRDSHVAGEVFNVACGRETSLNALFEMIRDGLAASQVAIAEAQPVYAPFRRGDIRRSLADISKARQRFGYEPTHTVAQGLEAALEWYVERATAEADGAITSS